MDLEICQQNCESYIQIVVCHFQKETYSIAENVKYLSVHLASCIQKRHGYVKNFKNV